MKKYIIIIILFSKFSFGQNKIKYRNVQGVIFESNYKMPLGILNNEKRFTPTIKDISRFEDKLRYRYPQRVRQYIGYYSNKSRILEVIFFLPKYNPEGWKQRLIMEDGGCILIYLHYDLETDTLLVQRCNSPVDM